MLSPNTSRQRSASAAVPPAQPGAAAAALIMHETDESAPCRSRRSCRLLVNCAAANVTPVGPGPETANERAAAGHTLREALMSSSSRRRCGRGLTRAGAPAYRRSRRGSGRVFFFVDACAAAASGFADGRIPTLFCTGDPCTVPSAASAVVIRPLQ